MRPVGHGLIGKPRRTIYWPNFIQEKHWPYGVRFNTETPSILNATVKLPNQEPFSYQLLSLPFYLASRLRKFLLEHAY
jgi:hypothetical protein